MKKICFALIASLAMAACGNETTTENDNDSLDAEVRTKGEESQVHPPEEGVPDSLKIANDSVLVPDSQ